MFNSRFCIWNTMNMTLHLIREFVFEIAWMRLCIWFTNFVSTQPCAWNFKMRIKSAFSAVQMKHRCYLLLFRCRNRSADVLVMMRNLFEIWIVNLGHQKFYRRPNIFSRVAFATELSSSFFKLSAFELPFKVFKIFKFSRFQTCNSQEKLSKRFSSAQAASGSNRPSATSSFFQHQSKRSP